MFFLSLDSLAKILFLSFLQLGIFVGVEDLVGVFEGLTEFDGTTDIRVGKVEKLSIKKIKIRALSNLAN